MYSPKKYLICISLIIVTSIFLTSSVFGNQKFNSFKNDGFEISFINAWETKYGNLFALFIKMKKDWKTYWRYPGESGFAPEFKVLSSRNFKKLEISWPTPKVFYENGTIINGYKNNLILPIFFLKNKKDSPMEFELELTMGFCEDICIPIKLMISSKYAFKSSKTQKKIILDSLNNAPKVLSTSNSLVKCDVKKIDDTMTFLSNFNNNFFSDNHYIDALILEYKDDQVWFSEIKKISDTRYIAEIKSIDDENFFLDKSKVKYTIITKSGGFKKTGCKSN